MAVYVIKNKALISPLFYGWQETLIWSCLQDCMGEAYADDQDHPQSSKITLGDFCFLAGKVNYELLLSKPFNKNSPFLIMIPKTEEWEKAIELVFREKAIRRMRYATKKDKDAFNKSALQDIISHLPGEYELRVIDGELYEKSILLPWAKDLCGSYFSCQDYLENGLGAAVLKNGELVSGASSYAYYEGGIEIEIDTRKDERGKGLASVCGAKLILECLKRDLYPSWDAQNKISLALAEKLGYRFEKEYPSYEICFS
ncbi:MAG: GNAT family N-acetyltransferase [Clostridiaceae bacterium]|nr:GNAT family N-acetyltransferase [Clostridiaceae bacterium]